MREIKPIKFVTVHGPSEFHLQQMGGMQAGLLLIELAKKAGPALGALANPSDLDVAIVGKLVAAIEPEDFESLCKKILLGRVSFGGEFSDLDSTLVDQMFAGSVENLFKLVWEALQLNYGNFFGALAKLAPRAAAHKSPQTA
jgi:hypothetical protein